MPRLLAICDYPVNTGFGIVAQNVLGNLGKEWDVAVIGINYKGDPHELQKKHRIYMTGNDPYGLDRVKQVMQIEKPDLIWILNDVWLAAEYIPKIRDVNKDIPVVVYTPIDSENIMKEFIKPFDDNVRIVTYTHWGAEQIKKTGYTRKIEVIPHGVDLKHFMPVPRNFARDSSYAGTPLVEMNPFVVLYVGRNQPRKRVDLFIYTMAEWIKKYNREDVYFHYHGASRDVGWNIPQLADYYNVGDRLILTAENLNPASGIPIEKLKFIYNSADLYFHASAVGGWELPLHEAMACRIACIVPEYSALSEWPRGGVHYIPVNRRAPWHNTGMINTTHFFYDVDAAVEALEDLYQNKKYRDELAQRGFEIATKEDFRWDKIAKKFETLFKDALVVKTPRGKILETSKKP